jgi:hypothetical protein
LREKFWNSEPKVWDIFERRRGGEVSKRNFGPPLAAAGRFKSEGAGGLAFYCSSTVKDVVRSARENLVTAIGGPVAKWGA